MFKPKIHACEVSDADGETFTFYVREPSGREILEASETIKKRGERKPIENARDLFSKYVVNEDGTAIGTARVEEMLDMRLSKMSEVSDIVQEKIGIKKQEAEAKNA